MRMIYFKVVLPEVTEVVAVNEIHTLAKKSMTRKLL